MPSVKSSKAAWENKLAYPGAELRRQRGGDFAVQPVGGALLVAAVAFVEVAELHHHHAFLRYDMEGLSGKPAGGEAERRARQDPPLIAILEGPVRGATAVDFRTEERR